MAKNLWDRDRKSIYKGLVKEYQQEGYDIKEARRLASQETDEIELINSMGDDLTVVNAARVSFDKESEWENITPAGPIEHLLTEKDTKLIKYLAKHNHFTPFTHCTITMRETVPIFVARQRFKHTIGFSYNEVGAMLMILQRFIHRTHGELKQIMQNRVAVKRQLI